MMKTLVFMLLLGLGFTLKAQNYVETMQANIGQLLKSTSVAEINKLAASFTRIAQVEKNEWLPQYYAAYAYTRLCHFMSDGDSIDKALDKSQHFLEALLKSNGDESEVHVLQALVYSLRITEPTRGYKYSSMSNKCLERAESLNPSNPRVYYCRANNVYYVPEEYGGGASKALPLYEKAKALFEQANSVNLMPSWGSYHNQVMLQKCLDD